MLLMHYIILNIDSFMPTILFVFIFVLPFFLRVGWLLEDEVIIIGFHELGPPKSTMFIIYTLEIINASCLLIYSLFFFLWLVGWLVWGGLIQT